MWAVNRKCSQPSQECVVRFSVSGCVRYEVVCICCEDPSRYFIPLSPVPQAQPIYPILIFQSHTVALVHSAAQLLSQALVNGQAHKILLPRRFHEHNLVRIQFGMDEADLLVALHIVSVVALGIEHKHLQEHVVKTTLVAKIALASEWPACERVVAHVLHVKGIRKARAAAAAEVDREGRQAGTGLLHGGKVATGIELREKFAPCTEPAGLRGGANNMAGPMPQHQRLRSHVLPVHPATVLELDSHEPRVLRRHHPSPHPRACNRGV
mmetsp:Transcript_19404/g.51836  ORF Transcript_19404/g.51836 Transcript_19404/m.51836 type:complete len:267 (-) Transcript_19404:25-825(-)